MKFTSKQASDRYMECLRLANENSMAANLHEIFARLLTWERFDEHGERLNEIEIGMDWDKYCFSFAEHYADGHYGVCGGIIFHGTPELGYAENGSCQLTRSYGWQIHT